MENENSNLETENDIADVPSTEPESSTVDPEAATYSDQPDISDGSGLTPGEAASDLSGVGESSQDFGDGSGGSSGDAQEACNVVSDIDGDIPDGEDPLQTDEESQLPLVIEMTDYSGQLDDIQQSLDDIQQSLDDIRVDLDTFKEYLDMSQDNFMSVSRSFEDAVFLLGMIAFMVVFQFCFMRIRNAVRSFTGRGFDK